jgi:hypothetical protein
LRHEDGRGTVNWLKLIMLIPDFIENKVRTLAEVAGIATHNCHRAGKGMLRRRQVIVNQSLPH